ncbi:MAG: DUF5906 domain-containing protein [Thiomicrospira sp.]|nr:DUF5906 domain-containing protein [Thiomicrospira sp.]
MSKYIDIPLLDQMLAFVPSDTPRDDWVKVLMAIKSEFGENGFDSALIWSQSAAGFKMADFKAAWKSIKPSGGIRIGTLVSLAKQNGFKFAPMNDEEKARLKLESDERARNRKARDEAEAKRIAEQHAFVRENALNIWNNANTEGQSDYLNRKGVKGYGVKFSPNGQDLFVPMYDQMGALWNIQTIKPNGDKRFLTGGSKSFKMHIFPSTIIGDFILVAEGYATAATLHEATGFQVAVAFDSGNLYKVVESIVKKRPNIQVLICADDDYITFQNTGKNPGIEYARKAAVDFGCHWCAPSFPVNRDGETDFNDLANMTGGSLQIVKEQILAAIERNGIKAKSATRAAVAIEGEGERRPTALSVMPLEDLVDRFIYIDDDTGDYAYDTWTQNIVKFSKITKMLPAGIRVDDIKRHPTWLSRAVYIDQIGFDPTEKDTNIKCNRWSGWPTKPNPSATYDDCEQLVGLLAYLCSGETNADELANWILNWIAYPIQNPGAKMQSAIVMHGPQGTGKSLFWEAVAKIYGEYSIVLNQGAIEDKFNSDWSERKLFVVADEIVARSEMHHLKNQLKGLITGEWVRINPKNVAAHQERNHMNLVFLSNEHQPIVLENDDRRHCVVWTPKKLADVFYEKVKTEIDNGGIAALHQMLLTLDLGDFKPWTKPPITKAKQDLIESNLPSPQQFINEYLSGELGAPVGPVKNSDFYDAYQAWCRRNGERHPRPKTQFIPYIKSLGWFVGLKDCYDSYRKLNKTRTRVTIPSDEAFATAKLNQVITIERTPDLTETDWVTHGVLQFQNGTGTADNFDDARGY